ncbi:MAG: CDP-diacylglycerol--serine O-phosphatidyltransferase [Syntrophomonadaceae bacterium]|nr:CDP-diacylglycerol--serine O-phosphatidyltransferase [Syntrophomonadaceae bacterium]
MAARPLLLKVQTRVIKNLANSLTLLNLALGMLALVMIIEGNMVMGAHLILFAAVADGLDGKVSTLTKSNNEFGKQLDSLADVVSFGVLPAVLAYKTAMSELGLLGFVVASVFCACGVLRLARFNVLPPGGQFKGLPITIAGGTVAAIILYGERLNSGTVLFFVLVLSLLMVSSIPYPKFKEALKRQNTVYISFFALLSLAAALLYRELFALIVMVSYVAYGLIVALVNRIFATADIEEETAYQEELLGED